MTVTPPLKPTAGPKLNVVGSGAFSIIFPVLAADGSALDISSGYTTNLYIKPPNPASFLGTEVGNLGTWDRSVAGEAKLSFAYNAISPSVFTSLSGSYQMLVSHDSFTTYGVACTGQLSYTQ